MVKGSIETCGWLELPRFDDSRGSLSFVQEVPHLPFAIRRVYYLYEMAPGATRGGHAHKALESLVICLNGSMDLVLDDSRNKKRFHLNQPNRGVCISPGIWRVMENFTPGAVCLVLASLPYDEADYIRDYETFIDWAEQKP